MKKKYITPEMKAVKVEQQHIICTSPPILNMNNGSGNQIIDENIIW